MNKTQKEWIDSASYEQLFRRWRMATVGDSIFQGEAGKYYKDKLLEKKSKISAEEHTQTSKRIGWG